MNQWFNVMRWEMRPRIFLRTAEFLWQEDVYKRQAKRFVKSEVSLEEIMEYIIEEEIDDVEYALSLIHI